MPKPTRRSQPALLTRGDIARLGKNQKYYEQRPRNSPARRAKYPVGVGGSNVTLAQSPAGGITSGTAGSPTSGTCTLMIADPTTAALTPGGDTVTVYNTLGAAIPGGKEIVVCQTLGFWYVIGIVC